MIQLLDITGGETDLISVRAVTPGSIGDYLALRQLPFESLVQRNCRVGRARHAHGLIYICPAGERITDSAAKAGRRSAEGFDLSRVIVRLIFKIDQPLLRLAVYLDRHDDGTGIDLVSLLLVGEGAFLLQLLCRKQRDIHEADIFVVPPRIKRVVVSQISLKCPADLLGIVSLFKGNPRKLRLEGRVTAVVRPIGVENPDLRHRRVAFFFVPEIIAYVNEVGKCHGQSKAAIKLLKRSLIHAGEAVKYAHVVRHIKDLHKSLRHFSVREPRIHRVDVMRLDLVKLLLRHVSLYDISDGGTDDGLLRLI